MFHAFIEAFHIISVIAWMCGMLYLPRLYVYHTTVAYNSEADQMLQKMERRLLYYVMTPAMFVTIVLGLTLALQEGVFTAGVLWIHLKLFLVTCLVFMHLLMFKYRRDFACNRNRKSKTFFRIFNEIPTVLMIVIVILVVVQPF